MTSFTTTGGNSRWLKVNMLNSVCDQCHIENGDSNKKSCLNFDGSEGEYGYLTLCRECINRLFDNYEEDEESE